MLEHDSSLIVARISKESSLSETGFEILILLSRFGFWDENLLLEYNSDLNVAGTSGESSRFGLGSVNLLLKHVSGLVVTGMLGYEKRSSPNFQ